MSRSFRVTKQIAWFLNKVMLGYDRIYSEKEGEKIDIILSNPFSACKKVYEIIKELLDNNKIEPDDIFILACSVKTQNLPTRKLENLLVKDNIPVYISLSDNITVNSEAQKGKVVFSTFH